MMPTRRAVAALALVAALTGCTSTEPSTAQPGDGPAASQVVEGEPGADSTSDSSGSVTGKFGEKIVYPDGVAVEVTRIRKVKLSDSGVGDQGQKAGDPFHLLSIRVTNGSKQTVDVNAAGGTMTYGPDGEEASMVIDTERGTDGMQGKVLPGKARTGSYGWVVPAKYANDVQLEFSFDFEHTPAIFTGPLK